MEDYRLEQTGPEVQEILNTSTPKTDLEAEVERAQGAEQTLQGNIDEVQGNLDAEEQARQDADTVLQGNIDDEEIRAKAAEKQNADDIDDIQKVIPNGATEENQLATEAYVNDSVATNSATFRGTYNLVSDLHLNIGATHQQIAYILGGTIADADNNDYCFVQIPTSAETPTQIAQIDRYKYNGTGWAFEYELNNSGYTAAQWAAINSGITSGDVAKLAALPTIVQLMTLLDGKQNVLTFDARPIEGSNNPVTSDGIFAANKTLSDAIEAILVLIPSAATALNQLADKAFVNSSISTDTATFRGTYNLVSDLHLSVDATHAQIATLLGSTIAQADNNDYAFVQIPNSDAEPTLIAKTERYKFNGTEWAFEYELNTSGFTSSQWSAINSGITAALVSKLGLLPTNDELTQLISGLESADQTLQNNINAEELARQQADETLQGNINAEELARQQADETLQGNITAEATARGDADTLLQNAITAILALIPAGASDQNQLADQVFVNSSVATATAIFRGTFNLVSDLHLAVDATHAQIEAILPSVIATADNNDYAFVQVPTSAEIPTQIAKVERYKYNGTAWAFEYELNNSGYTAAQWAAINSGITSGDVSKLALLPTSAELTQLFNGKQNVLTFDNTPTEGSDNPVKSGGVFAANKTLSDAIDAILLLIPSAASALNQLADKAFVNSSISTDTATFRGTYNLVSDLSLDVDATHAQIEAALLSVIATADNNDYAFVQIPTAVATPTEIAKTERYKFNGTAWSFEYELNTSGFTSSQWAAINSGITAALVTKLGALPTASELSGLFSAITDLIPAEATSSNKLADKAYVLAQILAATPAFKGQFTTLADLQAVQNPKAGDLGIVRTKDSDGYDVFTFYQYLNSQWNVFYTLAHHLQNKPATTGTTGDYPYNGMGRVVLPMNIKEIGGVTANYLEQSMMPTATGGNTIYVITHDYVLNGNITVPENCVLEFEGGSVQGAALIGQNTIVKDSMNAIFKDTTLSGTYFFEFVRPEWFKVDDDADDTMSIQRAYNNLRSLHTVTDGYSKNTILLAPRDYIISPTLNEHGAKSCLFFQTAVNFSIIGNRGKTKLIVNGGTTDDYAIVLNVYDTVLFKDFTVIGNVNFPDYAYNTLTLAQARIQLDASPNFLGLQTNGGGRELVLDHVVVKKFNIGLDFSYTKRFINQNGANGDTNLIRNCEFRAINYAIYIVANSQITENVLKDSAFYEVLRAGIAATSYQFWNFENLNVCCPSPFIKCIDYTGYAYVGGPSSKLVFINCKYEYNITEWGQDSEAALIYMDPAHQYLNALYINSSLNGGGQDYTKTAMYLGKGANVVFENSYYNSKIRCGRTNRLLYRGFIKADANSNPIDPANVYYEGSGIAWYSVVNENMDGIPSLPNDVSLGTDKPTLGRWVNVVPYDDGTAVMINPTQVSTDTTCTVQKVVTLNCKCLVDSIKINARGNNSFNFTLEIYENSDFLKKLYDIDVIDGTGCGEYLVEDLNLMTKTLAFKVVNKNATDAGGGNYRIYQMEGNIGFHVTPIQAQNAGLVKRLFPTNLYAKKGDFNMKGDLPSWCQVPNIPKGYVFDFRTYTSTVIGNWNLVFDTITYTIPFPETGMDIISTFLHYMIDVYNLNVAMLGSGKYIVFNPGTVNSSFSSNAAEMYITLSAASGWAAGSDAKIVNALGYSVAKVKGTTAERPVGVGGGGELTSDDAGYCYFDTQLGKPIYAKAIANDGTVTWVDATGNTL